MKLICGLGNPGKQYEKTRHNVGFMFLDALSEGAEFKEKWNALIYEMELEGEKLILIKPQTFMNLSGQSVVKFANYYKIAPQDVILVFDDVDLPLGELRFKEKGGPGTHNGMKSVVQELGTQDFPRLRIGIESRGQSAPTEMDLSSFVLAPFAEEEWNQVDIALKDGISLLKKSLA